MERSWRAGSSWRTGAARKPLAILDELELPGYHLLHAARANLLSRLGRTREALAAYDAALSLATNRVEIRQLEKQRDRATRA